MAPDRTEKKLIRVRLSVQVSYDLQVGDTIESGDLPFALDGDHGFIQLTQNNIDSVLRRVRPSSAAPDTKKK